MPPAVDHLYLSPHFDDAVLSCGGMIHRQSRAGRRVVVLTVCAGDPPAGPISLYAASLHARWGLPAEGGAPAASMVAFRRVEDEAALARLGAEGIYLDVPDVIYRREGSTDAWIVSDDASLFSGERSPEAPLVEGVSRRIAAIAAEGSEGPPLVYAPLGVGRHVDHWLVRRAAEAWAAADPERRDRLAYYEDYPYSAQPGAVERVVGMSEGGAGPMGDPGSMGDPGPLGDRGRMGDPGSMGDRGSAEVSKGHEGGQPSTVPMPAWRSIEIDLAELDLAAKIDAIMAYASQISSFWADTAEMAEAVQAFALRRGRAGGAAERLWVRDPARS